MQAQVHFEWVKSEANIADSPTRGQFELLQEFARFHVLLKNANRLLVLKHHNRLIRLGRGAVRRGGAG